MIIADVLRQSGFTDEQIAALDAKALSTLGSTWNTVETTAAQKEKEAREAAAKAEADSKAAEASALAAKEAQDAAELNKRTVDEFWKNTYTPGLAAWETERQKLLQDKINAESQAAFLKAQNDGAKTAGFIPADAPVFTPKAAPAVDPNKTPGTPTFVDPNVVVSRVADGMYGITDIQWKYQSLYGGQTLPIAPSELIKNADALKLSPMEYAARTYKFAEKEAERRAAESKAHDDSIAAAAVAAKEAEHKTQIEKMQADWNADKRKLAEGGGNNPDVKTPPGSSKFADIRRAVENKERPDPTRMTPQERRNLTITNVHKALEERQQQVA